MIEIIMSQVNGVRLIKGIRILEPDDIIHGIPVHRVDSQRINQTIILMIEAMGLRRVDFDLLRREYLYAAYPVYTMRYKVTAWLIKCYGYLILWLYDNARMFKQIPESEVFSWRYFTPYTWFKRGKRH